MTRLAPWHQFFIALEAQCCYALEQRELGRDDPDRMRKLSRQLFWNRWTRDRMHFLAGRAVGQSDLKGFFFDELEPPSRECDPYECCPRVRR